MKNTKVNYDSLREATAEFVKFRDELDWSKFHGPSMLATSLSVEVGELLEHFLWKTDEQMTRKIKSDPTKKEAVADELVDVLYHVLIMSNYFDIDLSDALEKKMAKNKLKYPAKTHKGLAGHQD